MACNIDGSGCKVCPGMWIAGLLFLVMMIQKRFLPNAYALDVSSHGICEQPMEATEISNTPQ